MVESGDREEEDESEGEDKAAIEMIVSVQVVRDLCHEDDGPDDGEEQSDSVRD
jgi:hypothetical protein